MQPGQYDLPIWRGSTLNQLFRHKSDGEVTDLTGSTIIFRAVDASGAELLRKSTDDDIEMDDPSSGEFTLVLTPEETRTLPLGKIARYEIERRIDGNQEPLLAGGIIAKGGVNDD